MSYFSLSQIQSIGKIPNIRQKNLERKALGSKTTVFLSHSDKDADIIESAIAFLLSGMLADGQPVTLKFADAVGEILTAGPLAEIPPLPFKHYI